jgi:signal transduction histidine kinase
VAANASPEEVHTEIEATRVAEEQADLEYLVEHVPRAFDRCADGLGRVTTIVRSMKEFSHPARKQMAPVDLNRAIMTTLTVATNEYKYVADLATELGELPLVNCHINDINQVVLNIIVNAAHAISDVVANTDKRGLITVRTSVEGSYAVIAITDTGGGIPVEVRDRIFDPFFTTKEVGKGTGQGLALAWRAVNEKHAGELTFESTVGVGTTFFIRLPIDGKADSRGGI